MRNSLKQYTIILLAGFLILSVSAVFIWELNRDLNSQEIPQSPPPEPPPEPPCSGCGCCTSIQHCCNDDCYDSPRYPCTTSSGSITCCPAPGECCNSSCCSGECCVKTTPGPEGGGESGLAIVSYDCCERASGEHCCGDGKCVKITSIDGPDKVCLNRTATFTAEGSNGNTPCFVKWKAINGDGTLNNGGPTFSWSYLTTDWGESVTVYACNCDPCTSCPYVTKSVTIGYWTFSGYYQMAQCPDAIQKPYKDWSLDGCSPWFVSNNPAGGEHTSFLPACNGHDICYQTCGSNRDSCDSTFGTHMYWCCDYACSKGDPECNSCYYWADIYFEYVREFSYIFWQGDQVQYCVCCHSLIL